MAGKVWKMPPLPKKAAYVPPTIDFVSAGGGAEVLRVVGADSLVKNLLMLPQAARDAANREMALIAHEIILDAVANFVPIDTGALSDSGDSDEYKEGSTQQINQIAMWFGGEPTSEALAHGVKDVRAYALEQHENMEFVHLDAARPEAGAKYLERPFMAKVPTIVSRIAAAVGEALGTNSTFVEFTMPEGPVTIVDPAFGAK